MGQVCDRLYDVDFVSLEDDSVEIEMSKPDEATSKIVMWLLSVIEAAGRQRENLLPANKVRTAARDGERGRARVGPGLGPLVMERLAVAGVVVLERDRVRLRDLVDDRTVGDEVALEDIVAVPSIWRCVSAYRQEGNKAGEITRSRRRSVR